nr:hypothetical protein [Tanacetum cinerariifolium]
MVVQSELGEGSSMPTDPRHTPTILQSSSSQPQKTHKPRKPIRKVTQRRIEAIDADEDITLVNDQDDANKDMFDVNFLVIKQGKEIMIEEPVKPKKKDQIRLDEEAALKLQVGFDEKERILAEILQAQEQEELSDAVNATLFQQLLEKRRKHFAVKRAEDKRNKPPTQAQQRKIMCSYLKNIEGYKLNDLKLKDFDSIKKMFDIAFRRVNTFVDYRTELVKGKEKRAGEELIQRKEVAIDAIPLAAKSLRIVDWKIHKEGKKSYYQIIKADGKSQMYMFFSQILKSFDREDLEDLYKLVKARYGSTRPVENMDLLLWGDLKTMFEPHV